LPEARRGRMMYGEGYTSHKPGMKSGNGICSFSCILKIDQSVCHSQSIKTSYIAPHIVSESVDITARKGTMPASLEPDKRRRGGGLSGFLAKPS